MGDEIVRRLFVAEDFSHFRQNLAEETMLLSGHFANEDFSTRGDVIGFELEACLIEPSGNPASNNQAVLDALNNPLIVPELAEHNLELNGSPCALTGRVFSRLHDELQATWADCRDTARRLGSMLVSIGILPTVGPEVLDSEHMSAMVRYQALNDRLMALRDGIPLEIDIKGDDHLTMQHSDVMLEAAATSFQVHLQCKPDRSVRDFNAALVASGPIVALSANSPFLFGKSLWAESRIPLFEQATDLGQRYPRRVSFGNAYVKESLLEIFNENQNQHAILLPAIHTTPRSKFDHLRFQNGTIWRWNRPLVGFDYDGVPHLRIEHRVIPAGPTIRDSVANCAAFIGFVRGLVNQETPIEMQIPFEHAKQNFYEAAQHGLDAEMTWVSGQRISARQLLLDHLIPLGEEALKALDIPSEEVEQYYELLRLRVTSGQTGANWQRRWVEKHSTDYEGLTLAYVDNQETNRPVHTWEV